MKKAAYMIWLMAGVLIIIKLFNFSVIDENPPIHVSLPEFPGTLSFAGEAVPLDDQDVHERLDRELLINTFWHSCYQTHSQRK
jgi:hypothetical protein